MKTYHYLILLVVWSLYAVYCAAQYNSEFKQSRYFLVLAITYGLTSNILWALMAKSLGQTETLSYAFLWDSGAHFLAFAIPLLLFGEKIKTHQVVAIILIFTGVSTMLFYEKISVYFDKTDVNLINT